MSGTSTAAKLSGRRAQQPPGELVAHHVAHEARAHRLRRQTARRGGQPARRADDPLHGPSAPDEHLRRNALAAPCREAARGLRRDVGQLRLSEATIGRHERHAGGVGRSRPVGQRGLGIGHLLKIGEHRAVCAAAGGQQQRRGRKKQGKGRFHRLRKRSGHVYKDSKRKRNDATSLSPSSPRFVRTRQTTGLRFARRLAAKPLTGR